MEILVLIIGICVAICALAMLLQIWAWLALAASALRMKRALTDRVPHMLAARATFTVAFNENRDELRRIAASAKELAALLRRETRVVRQVSSDAAHRYQVERQRAELAYNDVKKRVEKTTRAVEQGIVEPWSDVAELFRGVEYGYHEATAEHETASKQDRQHKPAA